METFSTENVTEDDFERILSILRAGGVIAFPTDTVYGLGADPFSGTAVKRIFEVKGRAETKPILLLVNSLGMAETLIDAPNPTFRLIAKQFWPGPLTLILPASTSIPSSVTAGTGTIGLRWPRAPFAVSLLGRFGRPLTATSANRSGMPSTTAVVDVRAQLGESIDALIDGGLLPSRIGSSLLDLTVDPPVLLREGPISFETLNTFFEGRIRKQVA